MRQALFPLLAALILLAAGCGSGISVSSDFDPAVDFTSLKTFKWVDVPNRSVEDPINNPLLANRIRKAVEKVLTAKGYRISETPDFLIFAHAGVKEKMNVTDWGYGYGPYWGPYPYGRNIDVNYYTEASVFLDIVQRKEKDQLAWRGIGTGVVNRGYSRTPEEAQAAVDDAVAKILSNFPPEPGSR
jgi:hypothetical protein